LFPFCATSLLKQYKKKQIQKKRKKEKKKKTKTWQRGLSNLAVAAEDNGLEE
jgi:hypothetical protein